MKARLHDSNITLDCLSADCTVASRCGPGPATRNLCRCMIEMHCFCQVLAQLERCRAFPDFNNYLALILAQGTSLQLEVGPVSFLCGCIHMCMSQTVVVLLDLLTRLCANAPHRFGRAPACC